MKIALICIGHTQYEPFKESIERYTKRIGHYIPFQLVEIPDLKKTKNITEQQQKDAEGALILNNIQKGDHIVLLDERGREYTSREFAAFIREKMARLPGRLVFVVGGPYGFSKAVYEAAHQKMSLSKMTFPHDMVRVFFVEQIYRAMTIMRGEPYHHD